VLNRLFVIIGFLVILAIGGAFIVPRFIQWGDYRERLESMGTQAFGAPVTITGDISLTLLPQPQLLLTKVLVGAAGTPVMQVEKVEAEFSLFDFLSDRYRVTRLQLDRPVVSLAIAADGSISSGLALAPEAEQSNVSIANADVVDGRMQVSDARSGEVHAADNIDGQLRLEALSGPFSFQGTGAMADTTYAVRVSTGKLDAAGATTLTLSLSDAGRNFTLDATGALQTGTAPKFTGDLSYRQPPPRPVEGETADIGRGDLLLEGKVEAVADRVLFSNYTLLPDENRAATRLTGAAELKLGKGMAFNAVVSGGVVALPPCDATKEWTDPPYERVRLLAETPLPFVPPVPGTIGLDIAELNLRGLSLRDLRIDASTDAQSWTIDSFDATLPGNTSLALTGELSIVEGHPIFAGGVNVETAQLDRLAALWRKAPANNPLLGESGSLRADVALSSDTLTLSAGTLVVAGINQGFDASIVFEQPRALSLKAAFTTLGPRESDAIAALLPDVTGNGSFGATFPKGSVELSASRASLFGLDGSDLAATAQWDGGVLELSRFHAGDLGGASVDARLTAFGTLQKPEVSGNGTVKVRDGAPVVAALLGNINTPPAVVDFINRSLPASLNFQLDPPNGEGSQQLVATGRLGTSDTSITAMLGAGIANALSAPIGASIEMKSGSATLMAAQLGLGSTPLFDERRPLIFTANFEGVPSNSYEVHARLAGGEDHIAFDGNVVPGDFTSISGVGTVDVALADPAALAEAVGAGGIHVPPLAGKAKLNFSGTSSVKVSEIVAEGVSGEIAMARRDDSNVFSGSLALQTLDASALLPALVGASGMVAGEGPWPEGPIDIGPTRTSSGRIDVAAAKVTAGGRDLIEDVRFGFDWDGQKVGISNLRGTGQGGTLTLSAQMCCSNPALSAKTLSGRLALERMPLDAIAPAALGEGLDGVVDASAAFEGTGETLAAIMGAMTGTGSYTVSGFSAAQFDPSVFNALGSVEDVVDMEPEALGEAGRALLAAGPFEPNMFTGSFTIAGGTLRSPNLAIAGDGARVFGGGSVRLADLMLDARYAMSPTVISDPASLVDAATAEVAAVVTGPLWAPVASYDVDALVDGMKIKASEIELARLEQLRLEDEARRKAAADERARVLAEQEAAAAAAAAAKKAAEEEAARKAAAEAAARAASTPPPPLDLGL
jgi:hypothetical protein